MKIFGRNLPMPWEKGIIIPASEVQSLMERSKLVDDLMNERSNETEQFKVRLAEIRSRMPGADYMITASLAAIYTRVQMLRKEMIQQIDRIRNFYITDVLLDQFCDDALTPDVSSGFILDVHSDDSKLDLELSALDERLQFDKLISDISPDVLAYGEYTLGVEMHDDPTHGIKELSDDIDQTEVIAITKMGEIDKYLVVDSKGSKAELVEPNKYIKFLMGNRRVRIDLKNELQMIKDKEILKDIPRYIRIGKSLLFPIISKIKELELLEQLVPASKLAQLTANTLIGVQVPPGMSPEQAFNTARMVENLVNRKIGVDFSNKELTIQHIMTVAGRIKVIPVWAEKGTLQRLEYRAEEPTELMATAEDSRKIICSSVGIPYELIFGSMETKRVDLLKRYARYLRKLKMIQNTIVDGVRQICDIHLVNKKFSYKPEDVKIEFLHKMVNVDELDALEFVDATVGMLKNINEFIKDLSDQIESKHVDETEYFRFLNEKLSIAGMSDVITKERKKEEESDEKPSEEEEPAPGEERPPAEGPEIPPEEEPAEVPLGMAEPTGAETPAGAPPEATP